MPGGNDVNALWNEFVNSPRFQESNEETRINASRNFYKKYGSTKGNEQEEDFIRRNFAGYAVDKSPKVSEQATPKAAVNTEVTGTDDHMARTGPQGPISSPSSQPTINYNGIKDDGSANLPANGQKPARDYSVVGDEVWTPEGWADMYGELKKGLYESKSEEERKIIKAKMAQMQESPPEVQQKASVIALQKEMDKYGWKDANSMLGNSYVRENAKRFVKSPFRQGQMDKLGELAWMQKQYDELKKYDVNGADKILDEIENLKQEIDIHEEVNTKMLVNRKIELERKISENSYLAAGQANKLGTMPELKELEYVKGELEGLVPANKQAKITEAIETIGADVLELDKQGIWPADTPIEEKLRLTAMANLNDYMGLTEAISANEGNMDIAAYALGMKDDKVKDKQVELFRKLDVTLEPLLFNVNTLNSKERGFLESAWKNYIASNPNKRPMNQTNREKGELLSQSLAEAGINDAELVPSAKAKKDELTKENTGWLPTMDEAGSTVGSSMRLAGEIAVASALTGGFANLARAGTVLDKSGKVSNMLAKMDQFYETKWMGKILNSGMNGGVNYATAGKLFKNDKDELTFWSGVAGGMGSAAADELFGMTVGSGLQRLFGDKASTAKKIIENGVSRTGAGIGELTEETLQTLVQMAQKNGLGEGLMEDLERQFPDIKAVSRFALQTFLMGAIMGGGNELGKKMMDQAEQMKENMNEEDKKVYEEGKRQATEAAEEGWKEAEKETETETEKDTSTDKVTSDGTMPDTNSSETKTEDVETDVDTEEEDAMQALVKEGLNADVETTADAAVDGAVDGTAGTGPEEKNESMAAPVKEMSLEAPVITVETNAGDSGSVSSSGTDADASDKGSEKKGKGKVEDESMAAPVKEISLEAPAIKVETSAGDGGSVSSSGTNADATAKDEMKADTTATTKSPKVVRSVASEQEDVVIDDDGLAIAVDRASGKRKGRKGKVYNAYKAEQVAKHSNMDEDADFSNLPMDDKDGAEDVIATEGSLGQAVEVFYYRGGDGLGNINEQAESGDKQAMLAANISNETKVTMEGLSRAAALTKNPLSDFPHLKNHIVENASEGSQGLDQIAEAINDQYNLDADSPNAVTEADVAEWLLLSPAERKNKVSTAKDRISNEVAGRWQGETGIPLTMEIAEGIVNRRYAARIAKAKEAQGQVGSRTDYDLSDEEWADYERDAAMLDELMEEEARAEAMDTASDGAMEQAIGDDTGTDDENNNTINDGKSKSKPKGKGSSSRKPAKGADGKEKSDTGKDGKLDEAARESKEGIGVQGEDRLNGQDGDSVQGDGTVQREDTVKGQDGDDIVFQKQNGEGDKPKVISLEAWERIIAKLKKAWPRVQVNVWTSNDLSAVGEVMRKYGKDVSELTRPNGMVYGFKTPDGAIWLNGDVLNANTPVHEFAHIWVELLPDYAKTGIAILKDSVEGRRVLAEVRSNYSGMSEQRMMNEALVTMIGNKGEGRLTGSTLSRWKNYVQNFLRKIGARIGWPMSADALMDVWLNDAVDAVMSGDSRGVKNNDNKGSLEYSIYDTGDFDSKGNVRLEVLEAIKKEKEAIIKTAKANGTYMKAPNGKKSNLTEEQWVMVRTSRFKEWFGDWELMQKETEVIKSLQHKFKNFAEAEKWGKENIVGNYANKDTGETINVSGSSIEKFTNGSAVNKSFDKNVHLSLLGDIPKLLENAILGERHSDRDGNIKEVQRLFGAVEINNKIHRVKITVKAYKDRNTTKAYSYEVSEIEMLEGNPVDASTKKSLTSNSTTSISLAKVLQNAKQNNGKEFYTNYSKVVDANGEPLVVYHGGEVKNIFSHRYSGTGGGREKAFFFTADYRQAKDYAGGDKSKIKAVFLNIKNPIYTDIQLEPEQVEEAKNSGKDGYWIIEEDLVGESEMAVFSPNQIKSATNNVGTYSSSNNDIDYQIIGQQGAGMLDQGDSKERRINNLMIAEEMETAGSDARAIRAATGWERGIDRLWRYEIMPVQVNENIAELERQLANGEKDGVSLGSLIGLDNEVIRAYPKLAKLNVKVDDKLQSAGEYSTNVITISGDELRGGSAAVNITLAHEVQHAIQEQEGFAQGGSPQLFEDMMGEELMILGSYVESDKDANKWLNDKNVRYMIDSLSLGRIEDIIKNNTKDKIREVLRDHQLSSMEQYMRLAGEVEARNVERRMAMSAAMRKNSLLEETEDRLRREQLIYGVVSNADAVLLGLHNDTVASSGVMASVKDSKQAGEGVANGKSEPKKLGLHTRPIASKMREWAAKLDAMVKDYRRNSNVLYSGIPVGEIFVAAAKLVSLSLKGGASVAVAIDKGIAYIRSTEMWAKMKPDAQIRLIGNFAEAIRKELGLEGIIAAERRGDVVKVLDQLNIKLGKEDAFRNLLSRAHKYKKTKDVVSKVMEYVRNSAYYESLSKDEQRTLEDKIATEMAFTIGSYTRMNPKLEEELRDTLEAIAKTIQQAETVTNIIKKGSDMISKLIATDPRFSLDSELKKLKYRILMADAGSTAAEEAAMDAVNANMLTHPEWHSGVDTGYMVLRSKIAKLPGAKKSFKNGISKLMEAVISGTPLNSTYQKLWDQLKKELPEVAAKVEQIAISAQTIKENGDRVVPGEQKFRVRGAYKTKVESAETSTLYQEVLEENPMLYSVKTNAETLAEAEKVVAEMGGWRVMDGEGNLRPNEAIINKLKEANKENKFDRVLIAVGLMAQKQWSSGLEGLDARTQDRLIKAAEEAGQVMDEMGTKAGQMVQVFSFWNRLTPELGLRSIERMVQKGRRDSPGYVALKKLIDTIKDTRLLEIRKAIKEVEQYYGLTGLDWTKLITTLKEGKTAKTTAEIVDEIVNKAVEEILGKGESIPANELQEKLGDGVIVVANESELPAEVIEQKRTKEQIIGDELIIEGIYYKGTIYIVAEHINSLEQAQEIMRHEQIGHKEVIDKLGDALSKILYETVISQISDDALEIINSNELYLYINKTSPLTKADVSKLSNEDKIILGSEYVSVIKTKADRKELKWYNKLISGIRNIVRSIYPRLAITENDAIWLIDQLAKTKQSAQAQSNQIGHSLKRKPSSSAAQLKQKLTAQVNAALNKKAKKAGQTAAQLASSGEFDIEKWIEKVGQNHFDIPNISAADKAKITALLDKLKNADKGTPQTNVMDELGEVLAPYTYQSKWDLAMSIWYANVLSAPLTQMVNLFGGIYNIATDVLMDATVGQVRSLVYGKKGNKRRTKVGLRAMMRGYQMGWAVAADIIKNGQKGSLSELANSLTAKEMKGLERSKFWGNKLKLKYVHRIMAAMDAMNTMAVAERRMVNALHQSGADAAGIKKGLGIDAAKTAAIKSQVDAEVASGAIRPSQRRKRIVELILESRDAEMMVNSYEVARNVMYNDQNPHGMMGVVMRQIEAGLNKLNPKAAAVIKVLLFPFMRIAANATNVGLDYMGVGLISGTIGTIGKEDNISPEQRLKMLDRGIMGITAMSALMAYFLMGDDDDDKEPGKLNYIDITGSMKIGDKDKQYDSKEVSPAHSLKIGDQYINYVNTPLNFLLAGIGGLRDKQRLEGWKPGDKTSEAVGAYMLASVMMFQDQSFLRSMNTFMLAMSADDSGSSKDGMGGKLMKWSANSVGSLSSGMMPWSGMAKQLNRLYDGQVYTRDGWWDEYLSSLTLLRFKDGAVKVVNSLGDEVKYMPTEHRNDPVSIIINGYMRDTQDPEYLWLMDNDFKISHVGYGTVIGQGDTAYKLSDSKAKYYEFVKKVGPKIRAIIKANRSSWDSMSDREAIQDELNELVRQAKAEAEAELMMNE